MGVAVINVEARRECLASLCLKHNIRVKAFRESLSSDLTNWLSANDDSQIKMAVDRFANGVTQTINEHIENELPKHYLRGKFDNKKYCDSYYIREQLNQVPAQQRQALVIGYSELYQQTFTNTDNDVKKANQARRVANTWLREQVNLYVTEHGSQ
jgi:hypothetical protein